MTIYPCMSANFLRDSAGLPMAVQTRFEFAHHPYIAYQSSGNGLHILYFGYIIKDKLS